jgi:hypothetical protein
LGYQSLFIASNSYRKKTGLGIAIGKGKSVITSFGWNLDEIFRNVFLRVDSHETRLIRKCFALQNVPSKPRVQRDPCRALGRTDPGVASSSCILGVLGDCRPSACLVAAGQVGVGWAVVAGSSGAAEGTVQGKDLGRIRMDLGHRPCRLAHRTPVLYSRNQSRTNIALCKEKGKEGAGQLAELLIMTLQSRGRKIRGSYRSASRTSTPTTPLSFWSQGGSHHSRISQHPGISW